MAKIADLIVSLSADIAQFRSGMDQANQDLGRIKQSSQEAGGALRALKDIAESVISVEALQRLREWVSDSLEGIAAIQEVSSRLGVGVESYQALSFAARQAGVDQGALNTALGFFEKTLGQAINGIGASAKAFEQLGFSAQQVKDLGALPLEEALGKVADRINAAPDQYQRAADAAGVFGRGWQTAAGVLLEGSKGLDATIQKAHDLGLVLTEEDVKAGKETEDQFKILSDVLKTDFEKALIALLPVIKDVADELTSMAVDAGRLVDQFRTVDSISLGNLKRQASDLKETIDGLTKEYATERGLGIFPTPADLAQLQKYQDQYKSLTAAIADRQKASAAISGGTAGAAGAGDGTGAGRSATGGGRTRSAHDDAAEAQRKLADQMQSFGESYSQLFASYAEDLDYQQRLAVAYRTGGDAVEKLKEQHAGETAVVKLLSDAQRDNVTVTQQQIDTVYALASADEKAKVDAAAMASQQKELAKQSQSGNEGLKSLSEGLDHASTKLLDLGSTFQKGRNDSEQFKEGLLSIADDLAQLIIKLTIIDPLLNKLFPSAKQLPTLLGSAGGTSSAAGGAGGFGGAFGDLFSQGLDWLTGGQTSGEADALGAGLDAFGNYPQIASLLGDLGGSIMGGGTAAASGGFLSTLLGGLGGGLGSIGSTLLGGLGSLFGFAQGGVVSGPTVFPFAGGAGLMGEAGPEAILPLGRTGTGDLGVRTAAAGGGGSPVNVHVHNYGSQKARVHSANGGRDIHVVIGEQLANQDIRMNGPLGRSIKQTYGTEIVPLQR